MTKYFLTTKREVILTNVVEKLAECDKGNSIYLLENGEKIYRSEYYDRQFKNGDRLFKYMEEVEDVNVCEDLYWQLLEDENIVIEE